MLLATAKLRSAVECPFAAHAGGKSRTINLRHVIGFFDRRFWGSQIKQFLTNIGRSIGASLLKTYQKIDSLNINQYNLHK